MLLGIVWLLSPFLATACAMRAGYRKGGALHLLFPVLAFFLVGYWAARISSDYSCNTAEAGDFCDLAAVIWAPAAVIGVQIVYMLVMAKRPPNKYGLVGTR